VRISQRVAAIFPLIVRISQRCLGASLYLSAMV